MRLFNFFKPTLSLVLLLPLLASSASALTFGNFTYEVINGNQVSITDYPTTETGSLNIPNEIDGKPVTFIFHGAFKDCVGLTSINIPSNVQSINTRAFWGCTSLSAITVDAGNANFSSVDGVVYNKTQTDLIKCPQGKAGALIIPNTVTNIQSLAVEDCSQLTSVTIPNSVISIRSNAFDRCSGLTSLTIPNSVTILEANAFSSCSSLTSVTIPSSITSISSGVFSGCTSLTSVTIPNSVTEIGRFAFAACSSLTSITIPSGVTSIGVRAFGYCTQLTTINIPSGVTSIADETFMNCSSLASITIPNGVASIGDRAFKDAGLSSITLPAALTSIGEEAFHRTQLTSVAIPDSVTSISDRAFVRSRSLTTITVGTGNMHFSSLDGVLFNKDQTTLIQYPPGKTGGYIVPDGVTSIGNSAFYGNLLASLKISNSVTSIGREAFAYSRGIGLGSVTIPKYVTSIGDRAFEISPFLTTTYFAGNAPTEFGDNVFNNVPSNHVIKYRNDATGFTSPTWNGYPATMIKFSYVVLGDETIEITGYPTNEVGSVVIPASIEQKLVTSLGSKAFTGCKDLTSITIPHAVTSVADGAFDGCDSLSSFSLGVGNTSFSTPAGVLFNMNQTTLIRYPLAKTGGYIIPNSVTSIREGAFKNCKSLSYVNIPGGVSMMGARVFYGCSSLYQTYFAGNAPSSFGNQVFDGVAPNHRIYYTNAATGFTSPIWNGYTSERLQYSYVVVGGTSIQITDYPTSAAGDIVIPDFIEGKPVTGIGDNAFNGCSNLTSIGIPDSVTSIGSWAFSDCTSLTSVRIPRNTTSLADGAFYGCTGLTYIIIPRNVSSFGSFTFEGCSNLAATYFAGNAPSDGINMFEAVAPGHTIYYLDTSTGFSGSWGFLAPQAINTVTYPAASWLLDAYIIYDTPLNQDLNGDGVSLLMAYALNLDPHGRLTNKLPKVVFSSTKLELNHYSGSAGLTYHVETSKNLTDWVETGVTTTAPDINGMVTASINRDEDCGFLRLVVKEN